MFGLDAWQQWYDAAGIAVSVITPGSDMKVRIEWSTDHGGQTSVHDCMRERDQREHQWDRLTTVGVSTAAAAGGESAIAGGTWSDQRLHDMQDEEHHQRTKHKKHEQ